MTRGEWSVIRLEGSEDSPRALWQSDHPSRAEASHEARRLDDEEDPGAYWILPAEVWHHECWQESKGKRIR